MIPPAAHTVGPDGIYLHGARVVEVSASADGVLLNTLGRRELPRVIALQVVALILEGLIRAEGAANLESAVTRALGWDDAALDEDVARVGTAVAAMFGVGR